MSKKGRNSDSNRDQRRGRWPTVLRNPINDDYVEESGNLSSRSATRVEHNRLHELIDTMTSEGDDVRSDVLPSGKVGSNLTEPDSPPINDNLKRPILLPTTNARSRKPSSKSKPGKKSQQKKSVEISEKTSQGQTLGEMRLRKLTHCMEQYGNYLEIAQKAHLIYNEDYVNNVDQERQYQTKIWYELKNFFDGIHSMDESGLEMERRTIMGERDRTLKVFLEKLRSFERQLADVNNSVDYRPIQRRHLSENHMTYCCRVFKSMKKLFRSWDRFANLFPSQAALEKHDKMLDSQSKEGRMFYEKFSVFQAWYNLNSEINELLSTLGLIMGCTHCHFWPKTVESTNISRPPTPLASSDSESSEISFSPFKSTLNTSSSSLLQAQHSNMSIGSPISFSADHQARRLQSHISTQTNDSQNTLPSSAQLTEFYSRYINDQLIHGRIELLASIFRSKHGTLIQKLRYIFRKEQTSPISLPTGVTLAPFDQFFKSYGLSPASTVTQNDSNDESPCKLMDEFFLLNQQLQEQKNPKIANKKKIKLNSNDLDQANNILGRFDRNPTLKSSIFAPSSAPTLILRMRMNDRSIIKRQAYFLDYLDPTYFPHLPGSSLFPDPCTFLDNLPFNVQNNSNPDEMLLIGKMLHICFRLYEKYDWEEAGKFSDMFELFHLPSLYPQYVFLVQIPLDLMVAWQKYHQDRKMEHPSTKSALLLLIDECKILIHSATLIREYVKRMTVDVFEISEVNLIQEELTQFDKHIIDVFHEIIGYIESFIHICLRSTSFHDCITMLKDQWRSLKRYATIINCEETLGERFLNMCSSIIQHFHDYINIFHASTNTSEPIKIDSIKKKIRKKYQKILTTDILREARIIYDDCALSINFYLQKPVCRRFLLILKTARFERIKFEESKSSKGEKKSLTCLLFAPAEFFEENASKAQLIRTLSSSFRLNSNDIAFTENNDDQSGQNSNQNLLPSPMTTTEDKSPPLVYVLCVPVATELENEWRGATHTISMQKISTSISPLNNQWKTTTVFLMTHQIQHLKQFQLSFHERLSKTNVQQNDFYDFSLKPEQILQKRSCFEKVDHAMNTLAHAIISLNVCVIENIEKFEQMIENIDVVPRSRSGSLTEHRAQTAGYLHTEERAFVYAMDLVRDTNFYATQFDHCALKSQVERQIRLAQVWLNFIQKRRTISPLSKSQNSLPMWLIPGTRFLRDISALHFTNHLDEEIFNQYYYNIEETFARLYSSRENSDRIPRQRSRIASGTQSRPKQLNQKQRRRSQIETLDFMDKKIDRRRFQARLIGRIKQNDHQPTKIPTLSKRMEQDLAYMKIRNFHRLNLLARGKYAITYKCTVNGKEVLCFKQYKIQHNDAQAINNVLNQLIPLIHINHENLIKYRGIALQYDHILFFMEYCNHGTVAQLLIGTSPLHSDGHRLSSSIVCSTDDTKDVDKGVIQATAGYAFFQEYLVRQYLKQLLSALSYLHGKEIIHRDIRNVNIFFTDLTKQTIKLGDVNFVYDFKFMKKQSSLLDMETIVNMRESIAFYAPETITQNETTTKSDVWSLGCALFHMLTGRIPWSNPSIASSAYYLKVVNWVANGAQPAIPTDLGLTQNCLNFLENCFRHNPHVRPSIDELLKHPFVKD